MSTGEIRGLVKQASPEPGGSDGERNAQSKVSQAGNSSQDETRDNRKRKDRATYYCPKVGTDRNSQSVIIARASLRTVLRNYAKYRDLGIAAATGSMVQAHVIRFVTAVRAERGIDTALP